MKQKKKQIIDISIDLFAKHGVKGVSLEKIGERAKLARTGVYYYFNGGKEQIIENILTQFDRIVQVTTQSFDCSESIEVNVEYLFDLLFLGFTDEGSARCRKINRIIFSDQHYIKEIGQYVTENLYIRREERLKEYMDELICYGKVKPFDTEVTARFMNRSFLAYAMEDSYCYPFKAKAIPFHLQKMHNDFNYIINQIITETHRYNAENGI